MAEQSTQSAHPWRASVRTAAAVGIAALAALAAIGPELVNFVAEQFPGSPAAGIVAAGSGFIVGLSLLVNRIALLAPVASFLQSIGLGPTPKTGGDD
jgi:hypothetical protein